MPRLLERINFPKVVTVLAVTFGIALGSCGVSGVVFGLVGAPMDGVATFFMVLGSLELAVMAICAIGIVITAILWVIATALGQATHKEAEILRLFDETNRDSDGDPKP